MLDMHYLTYQNDWFGQLVSGAASALLPLPILTMLFQGHENHRNLKEVFNSWTRSITLTLCNLANFIAGLLWGCHNCESQYAW